MKNGYFGLAVGLLQVLLCFGLPAKPPIPTPLDTPMIGEVDAYLLETLYDATDPDAGLASVVGQDPFKDLVRKHGLRLFGGPVLGCVTDASARFWVRTPGPATVQVVVAKADEPSAGKKSGLVETTADLDFTALVDVGGLAPDTAYVYDMLVDGVPVPETGRARFRTYPSPGQPATFGVAFGGGARYNPPKEKMWEVIASYDPIAFLFLGDNVYIDQPESRTRQRVHYYRRQLRPEYRRLTSSTAIYAIYDDHDLGDDDCAGGPGAFVPAWKFKAWEVFRENWNNPSYGGGEKQPGCWFRFSIGDVDFFMLDNRYYRSFSEGTMLGPVQKRWLLDGLQASEATFKVLVSGVLWTEHADKGGADSWWGVRGEREEIFSLIDRERIGGVVLLSADRHRTDVYKIVRPRGYDLYEFETSKLTNDHTHPTSKKALFSYNQGNYFGLLRFDFTQPDPALTFECVTLEREHVYQLRLTRSQLQAAPLPGGVGQGKGAEGAVVPPGPATFPDGAP
jgi:alkaline phosphatase D